jgi:hypothetical protein
MQQTDAPKPATPEAQSLLRAAGRDWQTVEILMRAPESPITSVCFHAQQYLEKIMKAVLVSNSVIFSALMIWGNWPACSQSKASHRQYPQISCHA